jgi:hypothetical protein
VRSIVLLLVPLLSGCAAPSFHPLAAPIEVVVDPILCANTADGPSTLVFMDTDSFEAFWWTRCAADPDQYPPAIDWTRQSVVAHFEPLSFPLRELVVDRLELVEATSDGYAARMELRYLETQIQGTSNAAAVAIVGARVQQVEASVSPPTMSDDCGEVCILPTGEVLRFR